MTSTDLISNPPRLLPFPWSDPRWTPSEHNPTSYRPQTTGEAPRKLRIGELKRVEKPSSKDPSVETSETASSTSPSRVRSNFKVKK